MPTSQQILAGLTAIAHGWIGVAIGWHIIVAAALLTVGLGWRPRYRTASLLIALLPSSVAACAFAAGNPFNGIFFSALTVVLVVLSIPDSRGIVQPSPTWMRIGALAMLAFGWVYPHFLGGSPVTYLYAAPLGLVPCPTLSVMIGLSLLAGGAGERPWRLILAAGATFYALFGVFRLGVVLDIGLLAGAGMLFATTLSRQHLIKSPDLVASRAH